jgi:phosphohistidine phosphatase
VRLYVARHGIAEQESRTGADADRALTPAGVIKTRQAALGLRAIGCQPEVILSSQLRRAWQTAVIVGEELSPGREAEREKSLEPGGSPDEFIARLAQLQSRSVLAVGHLPGVAEIASLLVCGRMDCHLLFKKAAVCCLSLGDPSAGTAALEWLIQPGELRALGRG